MNKPVRLRVDFKETSGGDGVLAYGLRAEVTEAVGIPKEIFVYHRTPRQLATGFPWDMEIVDLFQNVATPVDIEETIPERQADEHTKYYRSSSLNLLFRNQDDVNKAKTTIDEDIADLVENWRSLEDDESFDKKETKEYSNE